jgi:hypothetical protein
MVVMVTCKNSGHEYQSKVLQTPDEETLTSETHENVIENCPKCNRFQVIMDQTFIGNNYPTSLSVASMNQAYVILSPPFYMVFALF